ncbi:DUF4307 domain-containing protein [Stackebrandtia nassauensis]|uniref:DUF4307 domain-containing protein n=1 Tax=Stackebrandtia nassauensis (strain DSM 44728 / CIP 108903 / NRRL B-16338 / NBRC 102104 / LLR-40K-21) TaxID=446470 RepID=D3Q738_STANL|nr:DUF4307 domain-containing protein [Stackebrandtia nassauensis]ADD40437.1 hypothetical protein Snas_0725 [Stackebrandtia nassauensis DSM 44728]
MDETRTTAVRFPPGRYGRRREGRKAQKWVLAAIGSVFVAGGLFVSLSMYNQYGGTDFSHQVVGFDTAESSVSITFEVFKPEGQAAICQIRARSADGADVGQAEAEIPAAKSEVRVEYTLETSAKPVTGEVLRCYPAR